MAVPPRDPPKREFSDEPIDDAGAFLRALDIGLPRWTDPGATASSWVFRGQDDAEDPLLPTIWRDEAEDEELAGLLARTRARDHAPSPDTPRSREWLERSDAEQAALTEFLELADRVALPLPADRGTAPRSRIAALARHHGSPSSLLDFTADPLVAAFWATCPLRRRSHTPARLAVWAFDTRRKRDPVHIEEPLRAENPRLHAQRGRLLWWESQREFFEAHGVKPSFDLDASHQPGGLVRLTLPTSQRAELRRLVELREWSLARLQGTLDGVVSTLRERWRSHR